MTTNPIKDRIYDFIKNYPPFNLIEKEALSRLANKITVKYYEANQIIFKQNDPPHDCVYLVKEGSANLTRIENNKEELVDICDEGDLFGVRSLISGKTYVTTATTREESLLCTIPKDEFAPLLKSYPDLALYFAAGFASGQPVVRNSVFNATKDQTNKGRGEGKPIFNLNEVFGVDSNKDLVACQEGTTIQDAAREMAEKQVGSMVVTDQAGHPRGIITDTDFRKKVVTGKVDIRAPVEKIMSGPVITIEPRLSAAEVLIKMLKNHIHHLCVTFDGTDSSKALGMVSEHDLLLKQGLSPAVLIKEIQQSQHSEHLTIISDKAHEILFHYLEQEVSITFVADIITQIYDAITIKAIQMASQELANQNLAPPAVNFCWISLGSSGREEQLIRTDQDNAIIFEDPPDGQFENVQNYFLQLGQKVNKILEHCGFQPCPSNTMAGNPEYCQPLHVWQDYFRKWIFQPEPAALMYASIFFDYRPLYGDKSLSAKITDSIYDMIGREQIFLNYLANNALLNPPPLSFFRNFIVERSGEHKNEFDIKLRAMLPLVDAARLLCLHFKITGINNTFKRFEKLAEVDPGKAGLCKEAAMAYEILMRFRARTGLHNHNSGRYINPEHLNKIERQTLKNAFDPIARIQEMIRLKFQLDYFRL